MKTWTRFRRLTVMIALAVLAVGLIAEDSAARVRHGSTEIVLEGGAVEPLGDLEASYDSAAGFQSTTGYEIGFRMRQRWPSGWAIAPAFHYAQYGSYLGSEESIGDFETTTSLYRYGTDVQYFFPAGRHQPRLFLTGGAALVRNRMREEYLDDDSYYESDGVNSIELSAGLGIQVGNFEFTARYHRNQFDTTRFWEGVDKYDWDSVSLRVGLALPSSY